jgi:hypothetical protein
LLLPWWMNAWRRPAFPPESHMKSSSHTVRCRGVACDAARFCRRDA